MYLSGFRCIMGSCRLGSLDNWLWRVSVFSILLFVLLSSCRNFDRIRVRGFSWVIVVLGKLVQKGE